MADIPLGLGIYVARGLTDLFSLETSYICACDKSKYAKWSNQVEEALLIHGEQYFLSHVVEQMMA